MAPPELLTRVDEVVDEICSGKFHRKWAKEQKDGKPNMKKLWQEALNHPLAEAEAELENLRKIVARSYGGSD